ncbi:MAG TPA: uracil-DNA glycosylase [Polyangiaceae bacterium]|nr:uracil-DNA glycosylase [Polyangiaceae bacterium]
MTAELDPKDELAAIAEGLRAHLELCRASGVTGMPRASEELARSRTAIQVEDAFAGNLPGIAPPSAPEPAAGPRAAGPRVVVPTSGLREPDAVGEARMETPLDPAGRAARLTMLADSIRGCTRCALSAERKQTVFARGTGSAGLCFVGEGPGADEDEQGYPFVGKAGQLLDKMIEAMGFSRDEVYVCNIVKCRPPKNRKPEPDEMATCRPYLAEQLELVDPKVIVCLGATAVEGLLGIGGGITRLRGNWRLYKGRIPVMPTFHPAYLLRTPEAKREVWNDLQEVVRHMGRTLPARK